MMSISGLFSRLLKQVKETCASAGNANVQTKVSCTVWYKFDDLNGFIKF